MRIRATAAAVSGALALSALALPAAAQADGAQGSTRSVAAVARAAQSAPVTGSATKFGARSVSPASEPGELNLSFSKLVVNGGKPIVVGTTLTKTVATTFTVTHGAGVNIQAPDFVIDVALYRGSFDNPTNELYGDKPAVCKAVSATVATCKGEISVWPRIDLLGNSDATKWLAGGFAVDYNGEDPQDPDPTKIGFALQEKVGSSSLQRASKVTVNAAPEPVKKGKTITVTGKLSRANWEDYQYHGYTVQPVKLQFLKKGGKAWSTVKTATTSSLGTLKTTVKASVDGYWRFYFAGTASTPATKSTGDFVDVK
ncbi:hypothetical protein SAMN05216483_2771 [Streptomyces sp. 2131.1]|uniref:hypothetical protein n=1 Tax=Streptomyces sp. 2131.1 TaxID=1855346 RepID=UPI000898D1FE|nr:hypothetical protein [Streptomyces sp. 2131.1]SEC96027.1 hypothetical protein SAMN05216483_2771 [Streptomyces sp. 2131.1]